MSLINWPLSCCIITLLLLLNTLRPRQNGRHFAEDIFKCILLNENVWITIKNSLKFLPKGPINNIPALVQIMAWRRPGDKPLSEPMLVSLPMHICVTLPQWVKILILIRPVCVCVCMCVYVYVYRVYPIKYAHGCVMLCFGVFMGS